MLVVGVDGADAEIRNLSFAFGHPRHCLGPGRVSYFETGRYSAKIGNTTL